MAILNKGHDFSDGDQVTATKLDSAVDSATFAAGSVDNASTQLSGGAIIVKDSGVTAAKISSGAVTAVKLASNAVTTDKIADANVTTDKILNSNVTTDKIANAGVTTDKIADSNVTFAKLTDVIDDDTMATATNTNLPTSESIKAYVDSISIAPVWTEVTSGTVALYFGGNSGEQTYNISDFVLANGAASSTIRSLFIYITASANSNQNIRATYPNGSYYQLASTAGNPGHYAGSVAQMVTIPIAESQSNIKIQTQTGSAAFTIVAAYVY